MHVGRRFGLASIKLGYREQYSSLVNILFRRFGAPVPAYWFATRNFGDAMAPEILSAVSGRRVAYQPGGRGRVLTTGSLLHRVREGDVVCGTGSLRPVVRHLDASVRILAVRGPRTAGLIRGTSVPDVYGDPAQLLPDLYEWPTLPKPPQGVVVIPHHAEVSAIQRLLGNADARMVSPLAPWRSVVNALRSAEIVVSSSLHGIIVAEAFGRPSIWFHEGDVHVGGKHKFLDYLEGTRRVGIMGPVSLRQALHGSEPLPPPSYDSRLRDALLCAPGELRS